MKSLEKNILRLTLAVLAVCFSTTPSQGQIKSDASQTPLNDASGKGTLSAYQRFSVYPPDSQPLNTWNWDLLHPWLTDTTPLPMIPARAMREAESLRASGLSDDQAWRGAIPSVLPRYQFEVNKTILAGTQDVLQARLRVTSVQDSLLQFQVSKAEVIGDEYFGSPHLGSAPFSCEAKQCFFQWKAPAADRQFWGDLELQVTLTVEGMADEFVVRQSFFSSPMFAGRFTGTFRERIENGSLVIDAGVKVQRRLACFLSANLFSIDKETPTHHAERRLIVDPSMRSVSFTFFGKIFRDNGHEGVFRLQDLKGQCENLAYPPEWFIDSLAHQQELQDFENNPPATKEPARIYFQSNELSYTTRRYPNQTFSDREWTSPERTRKLEALRKADEQLNSPETEQRKRQSQQQPK